MYLSIVLLFFKANVLTVTGSALLWIILALLLAHKVSNCPVLQIKVHGPQCF